MGFISEIRGSLENPGTPLSFPAEWLTDIYNGGRTDSGLRVSQMSAIQLPVVFACIQIVSNGLAALPLNVVELSEQKGTGRVVRKLAFDHDLQDLLHDRPHPEMSSMTWRKVMMVYALLWGNAYSETLLDGSGRVAALAPRAPWKTASVRLRRNTPIEGMNGERVMYPKGTLVFKTTQGLSEEDVISDDSTREGHDRLIAPERMLYIPGLTLDGRVGQDTVWLMRQCFGLALATEKFGAKFFGNGARPGGILELLGNTGSSAGIKDDQLAKARNSFQEATGGENFHKIFVVKGGTKWTPISTPNDTAQFLETRKHQREEITAIFSVPGHMVGEAGGITRATAEQLGVEFVTYTLGPWLPAWSQELKYKLFVLPNQRGRNAGRYDVQFDTHELTYPTADSKSKFYQAGKLSGWLNTNMVLEFEGLNPIDPNQGGEDFWIPINMAVIGAEPVEPVSDPLVTKPNDNPDPKPNPVPPAPQEQKSAPDFSAQVVSGITLFNDAITRYSKRNNPEFKDFETVFTPVLVALRDGISSLALADMGVPAQDVSPETDKFISSYVASLHKRVTDFKVDAEAKRAVKAIAIAVYRELAVSKVRV